MKTNVILILTMTTLLFTSCEEDTPKITQEVDLTIEVDLKVNEQYQYDTKVEGDEDGGSILSQASHYEISELFRDETTDWSIVYEYKPELDYVGIDEVIFKLSTGSDGASPPTHFEFLKISFTISE